MHTERLCVLSRLYTEPLIMYLSRLYGAPYVPSRLCTDLAYVLSRLYSEPPMCRSRLCAVQLMH